MASLKNTECLLTKRKKNLIDMGELSTEYVYGTGTSKPAIPILSMRLNTFETRLDLY